MESGVEAGHGGYFREHPGHRLQAPQGFRLVQRGQVGQGLQAAHDAGVDQDRCGELGPAVHDAVAHGVDRAVTAHYFLEGGLVDLASGSGQDLGGNQFITLIEHGQLEAARPGVDDKKAHRWFAAVSVGPDPIADFRVVVTV